jgi:peptidyl-prolyl cis-trans isomerase B (cyclophilin B)
MSTEDRSNTTKKSTVYVALITALAIIIGSVILGIGGQTPKTVITFKTNLGEIVISTKSDEAPQTVAAISKLAQENYFDNTICHRLTTEGMFILQCGDPTGTGTGGPGFTIPDENLPQAVENNYPAGTVAMANAGPNTSGSQFFLVYQDTTLGPDYTIWGTITSGLDVVKKIASGGLIEENPNGGPPVIGVTIESTTVTIS